MTRWQPGASDRLRAAALELFTTQGYERTTAAEIAQRAGLTERTFYRHFDDKREVLFIGQEVFSQGFLDGVAAAPPDATPGELIAAALDGTSDFFPVERRADVRRRDAVVASHPALRERELLKLDQLGVMMADALRARGLPAATATLTAESAVTVFRVAFARWVAESEDRSMAAVCRDVLDELAAVTAAPRSS